MKLRIKLIIAAMLFVITALLFALSGAAVSALPGAGHAGESAACRSHAGALVRPEDVAVRMPQGDASYVPQLEPAEKDLPLVVIVIGFPNMNYEAAYDWSGRIFEGEDSLQAYYRDMSFGKFTFVPVAETSAYGVAGNTNACDAENDGVIHVMMDADHADWSQITESEALYLSMIQMMREAILKAGESMDFAAYDANQDGEITTNELAVSFVVAGYEAAATTDFPGGPALYLWSHAWSISDAIEEYGWKLDLPKPGGVAVSSYIAIAEQLEAGEQEPICVLAHELGHYLGLCDLYDTSYSTLTEWYAYSVEYVSLMANAWGSDGNEDYQIHSLDPWCRSLLGWFQPMLVQEDGDYTVAAQTYTENDGYTVLRIPTPHKDEYYLLENRQLNKWDYGLSVDYDGAACNSGIILWHIDESIYDTYEELNALNLSAHRPVIMPLFPESTNGVYSFLGNQEEVDIGAPFYDRAYWQSTFAPPDAAELPMYGDGLRANRRSSRMASGISVTFLSDSAQEMQVHVEFAEQALCPYCGKAHGATFAEKFKAFFHRIFYRLGLTYRG